MTNLKRISFIISTKSYLSWPYSMKINIRHLELLEIFFHKEKIEMSEMKLLSNIQLKESLYLCAKCDTGSLQCLFSKNNYSQIKKLSLTQFVIGEEDVQVFKNSLNLENIKFLT
ncbi:hypothetical protein CWI39_1473p0020 [Hamiltosporidium magnivora]|uniref:Uncharacterized protein n=1 Tax=Hamiltosporidium magnivora TaxID=148818 RepID=A0A4Q9L1A7_9MICR|nr:hypothetical protein CWI39_1473p0020 [Hamiltosporidium magnivora]